MIPPAELFAALCAPDGAELPGPRLRLVVNRTTLPAYGRPGATLYAPLAWPFTAAPATVRFYASADPEATPLALAHATIPPAELPPSRPLPYPGEPYEIPGGVLTLSFS